MRSATHLKKNSTRSITHFLFYQGVAGLFWWLASQNPSARCGAFHWWFNRSRADLRFKPIIQVDLHYAEFRDFSQNYSESVTN